MPKNDWDNEVWDNDDLSDDDLDDDENWDDDNGVDEEESAPCPECGKEIFVDAEMCPACGYWLTTAERHAIWSGGSSSAKLLSVGKVLLVVVLIALMSGLLIF
jgi:ribosomal protein L37E